MHFCRFPPQPPPPLQKRVAWLRCLKAGECLPHLLEWVKCHVCLLSGSWGISSSTHNTLSLDQRLLWYQRDAFFSLLLPTWPFLFLPCTILHHPCFSVHKRLESSIMLTLVFWADAPMMLTGGRGSVASCRLDRQHCIRLHSVHIWKVLLFSQENSNLTLFCYESFI